MNNKKGFTLTELIVSIALIAIVMVFMVKLLVDVRYDGVNEVYDTKDQINRAEIIKTIEKDLANRIITDISDSGSTSSVLKINITSKEKTESTTTTTSTITVNSKSLSYNDTTNNTKKWSLVTGNSETKYKKQYINLDVLNNNKVDDCLITLDIPLLVDDLKSSGCTDNDDNTFCNDSTMDNIRLTFYQQDSCEFESQILNN